MAFEDGSLCVEVVSNVHLEGDDRLTPDQEDQLERRGWDIPVPPRRPNWLRVEPTTSPEIAEVVLQTVETLREVFGLVDEDELRTKLYPLETRGGTPASPVYEDADCDTHIEATAHNTGSALFTSTHVVYASGPVSSV
jgi:hypothetical protein